MHSYVEPLIAQLHKRADAEKAVVMKAYMKNQFEFVGIQTPERRALCKEYVKQNSIKDEEELEGIVKELWLAPQREFQYCAIEILMYNKKLWQRSIIEIS